MDAGYREHKIRKLTSWEGVENDYENLSRRDLQLVDIESFDGKDGITQYLALYQWESKRIQKLSTIARMIMMTLLPIRDIAKRVVTTFLIMSDSKSGHVLYVTRIKQKRIAGAWRTTIIGRTSAS